MTPLPVPVLETERLRLRGHDLRDFEPMMAMWGDPDVTRFIGGKPSTQEEVWSRLLRYIGHWAALGYGYWAVEDRKTGEFLGEIGFADFKRDLQPSFEGIPELGWGLGVWAHGKGYATEAARAAADWGDGHFNGARMVCMISPENKPSIRVAEKCGFRPFAETFYKGSPSLLFERCSPSGGAVGEAD
ncbi:MAG: GNAT family N-acetyltransferase [Ignavibacteriales bacterium]